MGSPLVTNPGDSLVITEDWSDVLGSDGVTLESVTHTVPAPLSKTAESTDSQNGISQVKISGAVHGALYQIQAAATLSNGEVIDRVLPLRGFNS